MKKKFLASALAASMVGTMFASMPAFAREESQRRSSRRGYSTASRGRVQQRTAEEVTSASSRGNYGRGSEL